MGTGYNGLVIETLYKSGTPERGKSECYVLVLASRAGSNGKAYLFMEDHGYWDDSLQRFVFHANSVVADKDMTCKLARGMYEVAKCYLVDQGFIHSFAPNGAFREADVDRGSPSGSTMP
jgi:hypothetical protein